MSIFLYYMAIGFVPFLFSFLYLENGAEVNREIFCYDVTISKILQFLFFWLLWPTVLSLAVAIFVLWLFLTVESMNTTLFNTCNIFKKRKNQ